MKKNLFIISFIVYSFLFNICNAQPVTQVKYKLYISLPKFAYKQFEPVMANIQLINNDKDSLDVWGPYLFEAMIIDENGNTYYNSSDHFPYAKINFIGPTKPSYVIQPKDTLHLTMQINDWRDTLHLGDYKVYITAKLKCNPLNGFDKCIFDSSNVEWFEVRGIDDTDKEILSLLKQHDYYYNFKPYEEIINRFPDNPFTEHVYIEYLAFKYGNDYSNPKYEYINDLESDFRNLISLYPYSEFLLDDNFMTIYIHKHFIDINTKNLIDNFEGEYNNFKTLNENNMLKYFLKDKRRTKRILQLE